MTTKVLCFDHLYRYASSKFLSAKEPGEEEDWMLVNGWQELPNRESNQGNGNRATQERRSSSKQGKKPNRISAQGVS
jgi:hypothetical protein